MAGFGGGGWAGLEGGVVGGRRGGRRLVLLKKADMGIEDNNSKQKQKTLQAVKEHEVSGKIKFKKNSKTDKN